MGPCHAEWTTGRELVRADRDEKMKARCRTLKQHPAGCFLTRVHPGAGLPGRRRQTRAPSRTLVIPGKDARMTRLVYGLDIHPGQILFRTPRWPSLLAGIQDVSPMPRTPWTQFAPKRCPSRLGSGPALHRWEDG